MNKRRYNLEGISEDNRSNTEIARKAAHGVAWSLLAQGLTKGFALLTLSILAHLLMKDDFGLVAAAVVAVNYLAIFKDLGLGLALIQQRGDIEEAANTVFTLNLAMGFVLTITAFAFAPFVATYFGEPQLKPVLRWLGISFLINGVGAVHIVRLKRELDFRRKLIPDMGNAIVKGVASIIMALSGLGVWSLVYGQLAGAVVSVIIVWIILPWRPRISFNHTLAGSLLKYGGAIMGLDTIGVVSSNLTSIIVGKVCGMALLGVYTLAYRLPEVLLVGNLWVVAGVAFPAFSMMQNRPKEMYKGFLATVRLVGLIALPLCLGMLIAADPMIRVFFGQQWLEAIPILRILAICAWIQSIGFHVGDIYKAIGRPDILLKLSLLYLVIELAALLIGSRYGLLGIATGHLVATIILKYVYLKVATRLIDITFADILDELKPALKSGFVLAILAVAALQLTTVMSPVIRLMVAVVFGAAGYLAILWIIEKENILRLVRLIRVSP